MCAVDYKNIHTCIKYIVIHTVHTYQHTNKQSCSHSTHTFIQAFVTCILTHTYIHTYIQTLCVPPLAAGKSASTGKCGRVLLTNPFWILWPPTDCWPKHAIIWEMFSAEPFDPHWAIHTTYIHIHTHILKIFKYLHTYYFQVMYTSFSTYKHYTKSVENNY